jgi:hypothetical protein
MQSYEPLLEEIGVLRKAIRNLESKAQENDVNKGSEDVYVQNLDEIKSHLRDELERFGRSLKSVLKIDIPTISTINVSETVKLANMKELTDMCSRIESCIKKMDIRPDIKVNVPDVIVPEIKIPDIHYPEIKIPEIKIPDPHVNIDIQGIIDALEPLNLLSNSPKKPISVRLSDGVKFFEQLTETIREGNDKLATVVSTSYGLTKDEFKSAMSEFGYARNPYTGTKALTDGVAVQLSVTSVPCKKVEITVTNGPVAIGFDNTVLATVGSEVGIMLYPANLPYVIEIRNLNLIYVAGANGRRVCYNYYV